MIISEKQIWYLIAYIEKFSELGTGGTTMREALRLINIIREQQSEKLKVIE